MSERETVFVGGGEMGERMRALDWSRTPLGPVEDWSPSLRTALSVVLASTQPVVLFWGPELIALYNDGFVPMLGHRHPTALGEVARHIFPDIWEEVRGLFEQVRRTGVAASRENAPVHVNRQGFTEEAYFTISYIPVRDEHGHIAGIYDFVHETTSQVLGERRFKALRELAIHGALARDTPEVLRAGQEVLRQQGHDVPFALLYRVEDGRARLAVRSGVEADMAPESLGLEAGPWPLGEVLRANEERLVEVPGPEGLRAGPWPEPVRRALLLPLVLADGAPDAVLVVGLSPRLPLDEAYRDFLRLLARQLVADVTRLRVQEHGDPRAASLSPPRGSSRAGAEEALTGLEAGMEDSRIRPFGAQELGRRIESTVKAARAHAERERLLREVEAARGRLSTLVEHAPFFVTALRGPQHVHELVNPLYQKAIGEGRPVLGLPVAQALPESVTQGYIQLLDDVYRTGQPFVGRERPISLERAGGGRFEEAFFNFVCQPRRDADGRIEGIDVFGFEVTEQVRARQALGLSEERYRMATRATKDAIWDWDLVTDRVTWSQGLSTLFRHPAGEVVPTGEWWMEHIHPEDRERVSRTINAVIDAPTGESWHGEYRFRRHDGVWTPVEDRGWMIRDASGRPLRMVGAMQDISEREAAARLLARRSQHHALIAQVGLALSRASALDEMLQRCVEALVSHLGGVLAQVWLLDATRTVLVPHARAGSVSDPEGEERVGMGQGRVGRIAQEGRPLLSQGVEEDARWGPGAFAGYPLSVGDKGVGVLAFFSRHALEQDTLDVLQQVADSLALGVERLRVEGELRTRVDFERQLIGIVSHDLRNPLSAILMGANILTQREALDAKALRSALRIQLAADRATRMVKDLLDFTQARLGGGLKIEPRSTDLYEVTRGVMGEVEVVHPGRRLELRREGDVRGLWDPDRLGQVVQNLLTNALKYSPERGLVRVRLRAEEDEVLFTVHNAGDPIPPEKLPGLFEPMQRATADVDWMSRSVGLGLYIVKRIVDAHGGRVSVLSTAAEGTLFTVRLPRQPPPATAGR